jgi:hypothetical protein
MEPTPIRYGPDRRITTFFRSTELFGVKSGIVDGFDGLLGGMAGVLDARITLGGFKLYRKVGTDADLDDFLRLLLVQEAFHHIAAVTRVFHTSDDKVEFVPTGKIFVRFSKPVKLGLLKPWLNQLSLGLLEQRGDREFTMKVDRNILDPVAVAKALQELSGGLQDWAAPMALLTGGAFVPPRVELAEPEFATPGELTSFALPEELNQENHWHLRNPSRTSPGTPLGDANVVDAWELLRDHAAGPFGSRDGIVAVIDNGFATGHGDLSGDGKIVAPINFRDNSSDPRPGTGVMAFHGTACAGIAVGNANGAGTSGVAPNCRLMPVKWGGEILETAAEKWFNHVRSGGTPAVSDPPIREGAWIVSCSWTPKAQNYPISETMAEIIGNCASHGRSVPGGAPLGSVICFGVGNRPVDIDADGTRNSLASLDFVLAVAGSTATDESWALSSFGASVDVCAPVSRGNHSGVVGPDLEGNDGAAAGDVVRTFEGTSAACAIVAGVCALVLSVRPDLTAEQVRNLIKRTARPIGGVPLTNPRTHHPHFGYGCVDAAAAIRGLSDPSNFDPLP